jgi:hypothetical protein
MRDYEPLDLSALRNAGLELYPGGRKPPLGEQHLHGLPFLLGEGERCLVRLGEEPIRVKVGGRATRVLFAHALLESKLMEGEPVGRVVATYRFHYEDGQSVEAPVRERFEVAEVPTGWGQSPFLSVPDIKSGLHPRYEGKWGNAGYRQTEATQAWPQGYYLWAWENPRPEAPLAAVEMVGAGRVFVVGGITLSHVEEEPFCREAGQEVVITLTDEAEAAKPFALEVEVDRGVATYPYALPAAPADEFLADPQTGWGEAQNPASSPAYVEIAAIPSATVTVKNDGEELGTANWGELREKGSAEAGKVHLEVAYSGRNWVHTTVLDEETGKPVPCRVHFRSPRGIPYAPHGHHAHVNSNLGTWHIDIGGDVRLGQISYAYIDGKCQGWLPRGEVIVDVARGYEYAPLRQVVTIQPGQRELTLKIRRHTHLAKERYFSGDTHVHFLSTVGSQTEARGEDLNVVNLLQSQWGHLFTNTEEFTGRPLVSPDGETIVYATQENRQHLLGHLTLLGVKEPIMPWCSDGPSEAELGGNLETTLSAWADACHAQGGTVVIPHVPNPNCEPAALIATGRADAVEFLVHNRFQHIEYYRYLNTGYRLPLVGGTDKMSADVPVGIYRTYAYLPADEEFTYDNWCRALKSGNTFLSGGPLIRMLVDGEPMGATLLRKGGGTVEVEAWVSSIFPVHTLEIVQQGRVVASTEAAKGARQLRVRASVKVEGDTWIAARCAGPGYSAVPHHDGWRRGIMAHTSPVYIAADADYRLFDPEGAQYMLTLLHGGLDYMRQRAPQHPQGTVTHHHSHRDHQEFLEEPFQQAIAAVHRRMHELGVPH